MDRAALAEYEHAIDRIFYDELLRTHYRRFWLICMLPDRWLTACHRFMSRSVHLETAYGESTAKAANMVGRALRYHVKRKMAHG